jgi:hypothetical protein
MKEINYLPIKEGKTMKTYKVTLDENFKFRVIDTIIGELGMMVIMILVLGFMGLFVVTTSSVVFDGNCVTILLGMFMFVVMGTIIWNSVHNIISEFRDSIKVEES